MSELIGLNLSHNPSAVLINDEKILCAFEEEKLLQKKGYVGFPSLALKECMKRSGRDSESVKVAVGFADTFEIGSSHRYLLRASKLGRIRRLGYLVHDFLRIIFPVNFSLADSLKSHITEIIAQETGKRVDVFFVDHHLCHALSAAAMVDWENVLVVTQDGKGDGLSGSFGLKLGDGRYVKLGTQSHLESLGQLYAATTEVLGFRSNRHEGKITGLAAFGNSKEVFQALEAKLEVDGEYRPFPFVESLSDFEVFRMLSKKRRDFGMSIRWLRTESNSTRRYVLQYFLLKDLLQAIHSVHNKREDMAAGVQAFCEKHLIKKIGYYMADFPDVNKMCLAGGLFSNVKINQKLRTHFKLKNIFVQPAMDDAGTALGAAISLHKNPCKLASPMGLISELAYLGGEHQALTKPLPDNLTTVSYPNDEDLIALLAEMLSEGLIVGIFRGRSEWGPRALGNRSILAAATTNSITSELNRRLRRSDFMPFAPIVLEEDVPAIFEDMNPFPLAAKFMTITASVKDHYQSKFPAITHIDGTARPQIVDPTENVFLGRLLREYKNIVGEGILLNTSFNLHENPIVAHPIDAIHAMEENAVDVLVINQELIRLKNK
jgi:carbamoyltransferase